MLNLISDFGTITITDWLRVFLLYSHLFLCIFAISAVLKTDVGLFFGQVSRTELKSTAHHISILLVLLWATGLAIIYIDTGFQPAALTGSTKLLLKLTCVCTLTLNGMVLHHISFPVLTEKADNMRNSEKVLLVTTGALSTSHWLLAAFVGMSKPLARLPFETLLSAYGLFLAVVLLSSLLFIPLLSRVSTVSLSEAR